MEFATLLADKFALEVLHTDLTLAFNRAEFSAFGGFFTQDVIWKDRANCCHGLPSVMDYLIRSRTKHPTLRWISGAVRIRVSGDGRTTGNSTCIEFNADVGAQQLSLSDIDDIYTLGSDRRWRIRSRVVSTC